MIFYGATNKVDANKKAKLSEIIKTFSTFRQGGKFSYHSDNDALLAIQYLNEQFHK